jgi:hypothetical protein
MKKKERKNEPVEEASEVVLEQKDIERPPPDETKEQLIKEPLNYCQQVTCGSKRKREFVLSEKEPDSCLKYSEGKYDEEEEQDAANSNSPLTFLGKPLRKERKLEEDENGLGSEKEILFYTLARQISDLESYMTAKLSFRISGKKWDVNAVDCQYVTYKLKNSPGTRVYIPRSLHDCFIEVITGILRYRYLSPLLMNDLDVEWLEPETSKGITFVIKHRQWHEVIILAHS